LSELAARSAGTSIPADTALHSSSYASFEYDHSSHENTQQTLWHSAHHAPQSDAQHHQAQQQAAALCEAAVVFQQLAELQLLHEKLSHCLLCLQQPRSAVLLPCKHLAVCNGCCKQLTAGEDAAACPLCGAQVMDSIEGVILPT
jgi:hypothetical protein